MRRAAFAVVIGCVAAVLFGGVHAQEKKDAKKEDKTPRVVVVLPLGMAKGTHATLTIRGFHLEGANDIRFADGIAETQIASTGKAGVPDNSPEKVGDSQIVVDVTLSDDLPENPTFTVITPAGESAPHPLIVERRHAVVKEVEPNDGFAKPQMIDNLPVVIEGRIEKQRDVDVYSFVGKKGQKLRVETQAVRFGSALDPQLTLYRSGSIQIDGAMKSIGGDAILEVELPRDDRYYLAVADAHDSGGAVHVYRLRME